jgi:hypothetical protein
VIALIPSERQPMHDLSPRVRIALFSGFAALLVTAGALSLNRSLRGKYDFHHFYLDANYVWQHGELNPDLTPVRPDDPNADAPRQLPFYLPVIPLLLSPMAAGGRTFAAILWSLAQVGALAYSIRLLWQWGTHHADRGPRIFAFCVAMLLALPAFYEANRFNQVSYFVLGGMLAGFSQLDRRRPILAGLAFGLIALLKLLPGLFLFWLLLKRQWLAASSMVATMILVAFVPCLVFFGPAETRTYYQQWWQHNAPQDGPRFERSGPDMIDHFIDHRNQSIEEVLLRWTWPGHAFALDNQPLKLTQDQAVRTAQVIAILLLVALLWVSRRPPERLTPLAVMRRPPSSPWACLCFRRCCASTTWSGRVPALVLLARIGANESRRGRQWLGNLGVLAWLAAMILWIWPTPRLMGVHLALLITISILLYIASHTPKRTRSNLPQR